MSVPNRAEDVAAIVAQHMNLFGSEDGRRALLAWICAGLNPSTGTGGNWGLLRKNDVPGGRIPADILVWRPTLEHVDVLTDTGPTWIDRGPIQENWQWIEAPAPTADPVPEQPPTPDSPPVDVQPLLTRIADLEQRDDALHKLFTEVLNQIGVLNKQAAALDTRIAKLEEGKPWPDYAGRNWAGLVISKPR